MLAEHDTIGALLARTRGVTGDYAVPDGACASYQALYAGLAQLEADTHLHVHKENNLLFPAVVELEGAHSPMSDLGGDPACWSHLFEADLDDAERPTAGPTRATCCISEADRASSEHHLQRDLGP